MEPVNTILNGAEPSSIDHASPSDWDNLAKIGGAPKSYVKPPEPIKQEQVLQNSASVSQVGGSHYQLPIQPIDYCLANDMDFLQSNVIKYVTRHKAKNKAEDIRKAIHYCQLILEKQYASS
jgi:hypothetical protein